MRRGQYPASGIQPEVARMSEQRQHPHSGPVLAGGAGDDQGEPVYRTAGGGSAVSVGRFGRRGHADLGVGEEP